MGDILKGGVFGYSITMLCYHVMFHSWSGVVSGETKQTSKLHPTRNGIFVSSGVEFMPQMYFCLRNRSHVCAGRRFSGVFCSSQPDGLFHHVLVMNLAKHTHIPHTANIRLPFRGGGGVRVTRKLTKQILGGRTTIQTRPTHNTMEIVLPPRPGRTLTGFHPDLSPLN